MSTIMVIVLMVVVAAVVIGALYNTVGKRGPGNLRHRFGPEYDRVLARHNGDTRAADHELGERVRRHGSLTPRPLPPEVREQYVTRWTAAQERFVDSPHGALAEAEVLLSGLAQARGFPGPEHRDEHVDALSVHHAQHVDGYRRVHHAASGAAGTEEMREAMLQARAFFDALIVESPAGHAGRRRTGSRPGTRPLTGDGGAGRPTFVRHRHAKGSETS